ncbi:uncharacterized protein LOC129316279 [Prosopis cineraria]|uniref:uncharacterized protein LOC129316279 n=1 Tax=Prosopis cineraria TaxID=364024 RepID=UPI0024101623|nr:uncharacterized protein LOC129316279 [Prosopis cineraria]
MENHPRSPEAHPHHQKWGTLEELLLASAVQRHGFKDWDAVAMEVQNRTTLPNLLVTAHHCRQKFLDLRRRFAAQRDGAVSDALAAGDDVDHVPWLDELRKLRVAELQAAVQRSDVSILSLQLKVKRLEEERGKSLKENVGEGEEKPDLAGSGDSRPQNDKKGGPEKAPVPASAEPATRLDGDHNIKQPTSDESDRDNQSVNESNSTVSVGKTGEGEVKLEPNPVQAGPNEPDAVERKGNPLGEESNNGSYDATAKVPTGDSLPPSEERKVEDSSELRDSVTHSRDGGGDGGTRESSEVQSSASLTRKRKPRRRKEEEEPPANDEVSAKVQPLIGVLDLIKGHDHSSLFERRLESQELERYKNIVRQQMDYETIKRRLRNGTYSRCTQAFFRDLLLLFTNAAAFFPKDSAESRTAQQLGHLVSAEVIHHIPPPRSEPHPRNPDSLPPNPSSSTKPNPDSLLSKHTASAPILVCRKRSAFSTKPSTSSAAFGRKGDLTAHEKKKPALDTKPPPLKPSSSDTDDEPPKKKEKPVTGVRSLRRSNKSITGNSNKKAAMTSKPPETPKPDKSKADGSSGTDKKRSAAADFLKRIKRSAPAEPLRSGGNSSKGGVSGGKDQKKMIGGGKGDRGKDKASKHGGGSSSSGDKKNENENSSQSKRSVGRPPKKVAETSNVSGKRGRESGGRDKRPKKRSKK